MFKFRQKNPIHILVCPYFSLRNKQLAPWEIFNPFWMWTYIGPKVKYQFIFSFLNLTFNGPLWILLEKVSYNDAKEFSSNLIFRVKCEVIGMKIIPFYQTCMHACLKMHKVIIIRPQSLTFTPFLCLCYVKHNSFIWDKKGQNISSGCHWCVSDFFVKVCYHSICRIRLCDTYKLISNNFLKEFKKSKFISMGQ